MDEIAFALDESKTVIPLMHRECRVPFRLRRLHYVDFKADYQSSLQVLLRELAEGGLIAPVSPEEAVREKADGPEKPTHNEPSPVPTPGVEPSSKQRAAPPFRLSRRTVALSAAGLACAIGLGWYVSLRPSGSSPSVPPAVTTQTHSGRETKVNPKDNLRYVWIPPGQFMMGCSPGDSECHDDEKPAHQVSISHGFWMGQTEVTQAAYKAVTGKPNPSEFKGDDLPVEQVSWEEAKSYCEAVGMRLPTEAEWEYAARAGSLAARYGNLGDVAWYTGNSGGRTHPVAQKSPNAWGLYDVLGNVWEWCGDWYDHYPAESQQDPTGPKSGTQKVVRGGSWDNIPRGVRVSLRVRSGPAFRSDYIGFRCSGELR